MIHEERSRISKRTNEINNKEPRYSRKRDRGYALAQMELLSDAEFERMFRLDRLTFQHLEERISPLVSRLEEKAKNACGQEISVKTRLAVTLRWLAGGIQLDLCFAFGISKTVFFSRRGVLWPTIQALDEVLQLGFPLGDNEELSR